jgi:hypothetical protein
MTVWDGGGVRIFPHQDPIFCRRRRAAIPPRSAPCILTHVFAAVFYINIIIGGVFALILCFLPETLPRLVIARAVKRRGSVDQNAVDIALGSSRLSLARELRFVATMALRIMTTEPIVISLGLYNGFAYGLLFLYLDGVFDVFVVNNGLSDIGASLTYLNFCVGKFWDLVCPTPP